MSKEVKEIEFDTNNYYKDGKSTYLFYCFGFGYAPFPRAGFGLSVFSAPATVTVGPRSEPLFRIVTCPIFMDYVCFLASGNFASGF